ncbi:MAG: DUF3488 and transglutaminase-like domain-containing protein [Actinomycetota bacterium]|nr:DUF3488 and transglutaminase-like domain-containing protein [Actinomycetota bacterium]
MGTEARTRLALAAVLVVTLLSFGQVFANGEYPGPALLGMLAAGVIAAGARRLGWPTWLTSIMSLGGLWLYVTIIFQGRNSLYGLPTGASMEGLARSITRAYNASLVDYAPVPVRPGYVLLTVVAMWVITTIAEIATFRWRRPITAVMPTIVLFSFLAVVGTRTGTTVLVLAYLAALMGFFAVESTLRLRSWGRWVPGMGGRGFGEALEVSGRVARRMGAASLTAALVAPLFLPALGDGLLAWRSGAGTGPGNGLGAAASGEIDLLASLKPTLLDQSPAELFRVRSDRPEYWRLTTLSDFDGVTWRRRDSDNDTRRQAVAGVVEAQGEPDRFIEVVQNYTIGSLRGLFMPGVSHPEVVVLTSAVEGRSDNSLMFQMEDGSLVMNDGIVDGMSYEVTSHVPDLSYRRFLQAQIAPEADVYTEIPGGLSEPVQRLLERWTADAETPVEMLLAIQDQLRSFSYSVEVEPLATTDYLTQFLTETRTGYCQQFAAAFALLSRSLGFPTRVAVGFLPGQSDIARADQYVVRGLHAHSWPEVRFQDYGWVRFEPTPGNLATAPSYTIPPSDSFGQQGRFAPGGRVPGLPPNLADPQNLDGRTRDQFLGQDRSRRQNQQGSEWRETFGNVVTILLLAALAFICLVPLLKEFKTWLRYRRATGAAAIAATAFKHFEREAADLAVPRRSSESAAAFMRRLAGKHRVPRTSAQQLAALYERAEYSREGVTPDAAERARQEAAMLRRELWRVASWPARLRRLFSPAGLFAR